MKNGQSKWSRSYVIIFIISLILGITCTIKFTTCSLKADSSENAFLKLNELSHIAEQTTEAMYSAQLDLNNKLTEQINAEKRQAGAIIAMDKARSQLAILQNSVNKIASNQYTWGLTSSIDSIFNAESPQQLIEQLAIQNLIATEISTEINDFRLTGQKAASTERESEKFTIYAEAAVEQSTFIRKNLESKQNQLQVQIVIVESQYQALTSSQQKILKTLPNAITNSAFNRLLSSNSNNSGIIIQAALSRIGYPYSWGGAGPSSFDCSGLVVWAFYQAGIVVPHSSQALSYGGRSVSIDSIQPGDLVIYYSDASHIGIYIGEGMMIHASTYGTPVRVSPINDAPIWNIRRY